MEKKRKAKEKKRKTNPNSAQNSLPPFPRPTAHLAPWLPLPPYARPSERPSTPPAARPSSLSGFCRVGPASRRPPPAPPSCRHRAGHPDGNRSRSLRDFLVPAPNQAPIKFLALPHKHRFDLDASGKPQPPLASRSGSRRVPLARPTLFQAPSGRDRSIGEFARSFASFPCSRFVEWCPKSSRLRTPTSLASQQWCANARRLSFGRPAARFPLKQISAVGSKTKRPD